MNKIRFIANMDTNYVFHMLSVSKCGYDNSYGQHYAPRYPAEDLAVLKTQEKLITVRGGEHCGALYGIFVCEAACAKLSAKDYYTKLIQKSKPILAGHACWHILHHLCFCKTDLTQLANTDKLCLLERDPATVNRHNDTADVF